MPRQGPARALRHPGGSGAGPGNRAPAQRGVGCPGPLGGRLARLAREGGVGGSSSRRGRAVTDDSTGATLPPAGRDRMAEIRGSGTWGSALSTDEFTAIRGVGFEPVGQVLGACVYNIGYAGGFNRPGGRARGGFGGGGPGGGHGCRAGGGGGLWPPRPAPYAAR